MARTKRHSRGPRRRAVRLDVTWYGDEFLQIVADGGDEAMFAAGQVLADEARRRAPRGRRGNLQKSAYVSTASRSTFVKRPFWRKEKRPPAGGATIGFSAPHAHLIESGRRRAGVIAPRIKRGRKALRIGSEIRARSHFRRVSSRPYLGPALEATKETMVRELAHVLNRKLEAGMPRR